MSKQYAHLHTMAKTSVKFQNDWPKTEGGVALKSQLLTNGQTDGSRHAYIAPALARRCDKKYIILVEKSTLSGAKSMHLKDGY